MKRRGLLLFALLTALTACTGSEAEEPLDNKPPRVPDAPGDGGETAEKPAGQGQANGAQATTTQDANAPKTNAPSGNKPQSEIHGDMYVTADVNVRSEPNKTSKVARVVKKGTKVDVKACKLGWCQIGEQEYVALKLLTATP